MALFKPTAPKTMAKQTYTDQIATADYRSAFHSAMSIVCNPATTRTSQGKISVSQMLWCRAYKQETDHSQLPGGGLDWSQLRFGDCRSKSGDLMALPLRDVDVSIPGLRAVCHFISQPAAQKISHHGSTMSDGLFGMNVAKCFAMSSVLEKHSTFSVQPLPPTLYAMSREEYHSSAEMSPMMHDFDPKEWTMLLLQKYNSVDSFIIQYAFVSGDNVESMARLRIANFQEVLQETDSHDRVALEDCQRTLSSMEYCSESEVRSLLPVIQGLFKQQSKLLKYKLEFFKPDGSGDGNDAWRFKAHKEMDYDWVNSYWPGVDQSLD